MNKEKKFKDTLMDFMVEEDLNQVEVAEILKVTRQTVGLWLRDELKPPEINQKKYIHRMERYKEE